LRAHQARARSRDAGRTRDGQPRDRRDDRGVDAHGGEPPAACLREARRQRPRRARRRIGERRLGSTPVATDPEVRAELVGTVRRFVEREVVPVASELEHADEYPAAIVDGMRELGLFGITIPEDYGGLGLDLPTYCGGIEELAAGWMLPSGGVHTDVIAADLVKADRPHEPPT